MTLCCFVCLALPSLPCLPLPNCPAVLLCATAHTLQKDGLQQLNSVLAVQALRGIPTQGRLGSRTQRLFWQLAAQT